MFAFVAFVGFTLLSAVGVYRDPSQRIRWINLFIGLLGAIMTLSQLV